ncbi:MAG: hypothetical protein R6W76_01135 [Caldilinea sp.]
MNVWEKAAQNSQPERMALSTFSHAVMPVLQRRETHQQNRLVASAAWYDSDRVKRRNVEAVDAVLRRKNDGRRFD